MWRSFFRIFNAGNSQQNGNCPCRLLTTTCTKKDKVEANDDDIAAFSDNPDSFGTHPNVNDNIIPTTDFQKYKLRNAETLKKFDQLIENNPSRKYFSSTKNKAEEYHHKGNTKLNSPLRNNEDNHPNTEILEIVAEKSTTHENLSNKSKLLKKKGLYTKNVKSITKEGKTCSNKFGSSDEFGALSTEHNSYENYEGDGEDVHQEQHENARSQHREPTEVYSIKIRKLCKEGKVSI